ncbi:uncharacterized protein LOC116738670 [Nasonia vitripennis]|uniref:Uncharacterized protein n=1 Tax=Nasonia vitripennis TaxID=7425 RepID=A0A7M7R5I0_NASVI|nr:uncharacterized protein LOC116738670 [Nasonia vitripennis]
MDLTSSSTDDEKIIPKKVLVLSENYEPTNAATLLQYTGGAALLGLDTHKIPLILSGDININFADDKSEPLKKFLIDKFNLTMNNSSSQSTTNYGTTIDAVFSRFIDNIQSETYTCYFSYHKPIVSIINCDK